MIEQEIHTWQRTKRPLTGMKLRKPKSITRAMLDRWDICFEGITWFNHVAPRGRFLLTEQFIDEAFSRHTVDIRFKTVWLGWLAIRLFTDLSRQTDGNATANRALNAKLREYSAAITRVNLKRDLPQGLLMIEQARLAHLLINMLSEL